MTQIEGTRSVVIVHMTVRYGKKVALDDVTLSVPPGSVYALLGRNGAGKSSLVRCLLGEQKPASGTAFLLGRDVWKHRARLMQHVGVVAEEPDAPPEMTPAQLIDFCSRLYDKWDQNGVVSRLDKFGVPLKTPFGRLSKGQKREVMLALALGPSPDILVVDDPTLGLDVVARKELFEELIGELAERGMTVFITTHDLAGVEGIADRVAILRDGRLALEEEMETLKWRFRRLRYGVPPGMVTTVGLEHLEAVGVKQWGLGVEAVVSKYDDLAFDRFRSTAGVRDVEVAGMSLEEIFVAVNDVQEGACA